MNHPDPLAQRKYQVRFDWGLGGARRIARDAAVVVLVDALTFTTEVVVAAERGMAVVPWPADAAGAEAVAGRRGGSAPEASVVVLLSPDGGAIARAFADGALERDADAGAPVVLAASLRNRSAVARRVLELQEQRGARLSVAVIAAGALEHGELRFAVEDQLAAGAVIDALVALGIDHTSPEAAAACASFEGLRRAVVHLTSASGSAAVLRERGSADDVRLASELDASEAVPELQDGVFRA